MLVGDLIEGINPTDKRFEYESHKMPIVDQVLSVKKLLHPIRKKILCIGRGNHETKIGNSGDHIKALCEDLKVPYGTVSFKLIVKDGSGALMYKIFCTHPHSGIIRSSASDPILREATEKVQLKKRLAREKWGDCVLNLAAHYHKAIIVPPYIGDEPYLIDDGKKIKQKYIAEADPTDQYIDENLRWYASIPGWIRKHSLGTSGYVERAGLPPLPLGCLRIIVRNRKIMRVEKILV